MTCLDTAMAQCEKDSRIVENDYDEDKKTHLCQEEFEHIKIRNVSVGAINIIWEYISSYS